MWACGTCGLSKVVAIPESGILHLARSVDAVEERLDSIWYFFPSARDGEVQSVIHTHRITNARNIRYCVVNSQVT